MPPASSRPRPSRRLTAALLLAALAVQAPHHAGAEPAAPVRVARAAAATTSETLRLTGTVTAERRARLSPRASGLVEVVHVDAGDAVEKGTVLLELDRVLAELAVRRAEAALAEARALVAESRRLQSEAKELVVDNYIPATEARARGANVEINEAAAARLGVEVREAKERLARHTVVAPFAGVIGRKLTEAGEWVETGTPVLELVGIDHLRLDVQAPQERFLDIDANTQVSVRLDGLTDEVFAAKVGAVVPVNDPGARTFLVRLLVDDEGGRMVPGMSAEASFGIRGARNAVTVPRDALVRGPDGGDRVWVVESAEGEERAFPRSVRVGRSLAETVEVVEGVEPGATVVVRGNESLREGQPVTVLGAM